MAALEDNLKLLARIQSEADCKILLALKGFSTFSTFPLVRKYLTGATSSSPHEAQLAREELGGEVHCYAPAFTESDLREVLRFSDHVVFNSFPLTVAIMNGRDTIKVSSDNGATLTSLPSGPLALSATASGGGITWPL